MHTLDTTTPSAPSKERGRFLEAQPPLLGKEGTRFSHTAIRSHPRGSSAVIDRRYRRSNSDFGSEVQESSDFKFLLLPPHTKYGLIWLPNRSRNEGKGRRLA